LATLRSSSMLGSTGIVVIDGTRFLMKRFNWSRET
jgi:hypothetical protein